MIDFFHTMYYPCDKSHTYRRITRKEYLALTKKNVERRRGYDSNLKVVNFYLKYKSSASNKDV